MRIRTLIGAALMGMTGPAFASVDPPWGHPVCNTFKPDYERDKKGLPFAPPESRFLPQPYVFERRVYAGIFELVEQWYDPHARLFWPELKFEEHRNFVRITRSAPGKPPRQVQADGRLHFIYNALRFSMRIDKCNGAISELRFEKGG